MGGTDKRLMLVRDVREYGERYGEGGGEEREGSKTRCLSYSSPKKYETSEKEDSGWR